MSETDYVNVKMLEVATKRAEFTPRKMAFTKADLAVLTEIHRECVDRMKWLDSNSRRLGHLLLEFRECLDELRTQLD